MKGVDSRLAHSIMDEIVDSSAPVSWDDIAGQEVSREDLSFYVSILVCLFFVYLISVSWEDVTG